MNEEDKEQAVYIAEYVKSKIGKEWKIEGNSIIIETGYRATKKGKMKASLMAKLINKAMEKEAIFGEADYMEDNEKYNIVITIHEVD